MKQTAILALLALAGCASSQPSVGDAYAAYMIAVNNAASFAEGAGRHEAGTVRAMAEFNDSKPMTDAVDTAETYLVCKSPTPHKIPDYDCGGLPKDMRPVVKQLEYGAFVLRQGRFAIMDMHGMDPAVKGKTHDAH